MVSAIAAAASMTCSQLSRTSRTFLPPIARATDSGDISSPCSCRSSDMSNRRRHQIGIRQRHQLDEQDIALEGRKQPAGHFGRQHGLADAARPGQRHHTVGRYQVAELLHGASRDR